MIPLVVAARNDLPLRRLPQANGAKRALLPHGSAVRLKAIAAAAPDWAEVEVDFGGSVLTGFCLRRFLDQDVGSFVPELPTASSRMWNETASWIAAGTGYALGAKDDALLATPSRIDCSGWVARLLRVAMEAENARAGEAVFHHDDIEAVETYSDNIVVEIERRTGHRLAGSAITVDALRAGWVIGIDNGVAAWEQNAPRRYGIDHCVLVVRNPDSKALYVSQSSASGNGVNRVALDYWLERQTAAGRRTGEQMIAVDAFRLADPFTRAIGRIVVPDATQRPSSVPGAAGATLTPAILAALYPRAPAAHLSAFAEQAPALLSAFEIDRNDNRLHFFLAQIGHESGGLTMMVENMNYRAEGIVKSWPTRFATVAEAQPYAGSSEKLANRVYADRMGNGSEESGDGYRYRGHGYIQLTGRGAYRDVGAIGPLASLDLENNPARAAAPAHALHVACGFWQWKGLNAICDTGDFTAVTKKINGGVKGLAEREAWLDKVRRTFAIPPAPGAASVADVIAVQQALRAAGYQEVGAADGVIGARTLAAITRFRQERGLPARADARAIDNELREALGIPRV